MALVIYELDLEFAETAVLLGVERVVDEFVLGADGLIDGPEIVRQFADEARSEEHAAGHSGRRSASGCRPGGNPFRGSGHPPPPRPSDMMRETAPVETVKMVTSGVFLTLSRILSRVILEKVSRPEAMRMMYFWPSMRLSRSSPSYRASKRLRFREAGNAELVDVLEELALVLGEVGHDLGVQIEGHHGNVVLGSQLFGKGEG